MPDSRSTRWRWTHMYLPYLVLAFACLVGFWRMNGIIHDLHEGDHRDCAARVEGRQALRDVVIDAYRVQPGTPPDRVAAITERRDHLLHKAPKLHCVNDSAVPIKESHD